MTFSWLAKKQKAPDSLHVVRDMHRNLVSLYTRPRQRWPADQLDQETMRWLTEVFMIDRSGDG